MDGIVQTIIPIKAYRGSISYKKPPKIVNTAVLQLRASAEYMPWAFGICAGEIFLIKYFINA